MLTRTGDIHLPELIEAAKPYLKLYGVGKVERQECRVPFKDLDKGKKMYMVFLWLANQWVFTEVTK